MNDKIFDPLLEILYKEGFSEEEISNLMFSLTSFVQKQFGEEIVSRLKEDQVAQINEAESQDHANYLIAQFVGINENRSVQEISDEMLTNAVKELMDGLVSDKETTLNEINKMISDASKLANQAETPGMSSLPQGMPQ